MKPEAQILKEVMLAIGSQPDCRIFRNSVGQARDPRTGQHVRFGLTAGASDIIGIGPRGRFLALECKSETGRATAEQLVFLDVVKRMGGIAGVVRSAAEAIQLVEANR